MKNFKKDVKVVLIVTYNSTKLSFYTNTKDRIDKLVRFYIVSIYCCPGCSKSYIGKMERTFLERINEHACKDKKSLGQNHINKCDRIKYLVDLTNNEGLHIKRKIRHLMML